MEKSSPGIVGRGGGGRISIYGNEAQGFSFFGESSNDVKFMMMLLLATL